MTYRWKVDSPESLVQLIAANYLRYGYFWYVTGYVRPDKEIKTVASRLIEKYRIDISERQRTHDKSKGIARVQVIFYSRWFILLVTEGNHQIKQAASKGGEGDAVRDCRRNPIRFEGYSISYRRASTTSPGESEPRWHAHVKIDAPTYRQLKQQFAKRACNRSVRVLARDFEKVPYARYAPVRRQLLCIWRQTNRLRASRGLEAVPKKSLQLRRSPVKVYAEAVHEVGH